MAPATQVAFASYTRPRPVELDADAVRALLLESGLWTALRTRPFSPGPGARFQAARDLRHRDRHASARAGGRRRAGGPRRGFRGRRPRRRASSAMGKTYVCKARGLARRGPAGRRMRRRGIRGPASGRHRRPAHPPARSRSTLDKTVWHIGYQDVAAIGRLFTTGKLDVERVVSLAGPGAVRPRLLRTRLGASIDVLTRGELNAGRAARDLGLGARRAHRDGRSARLSRPLPPADRRCCRKAASASSSAGSRPARDKFSLWGVVLGALGEARAGWR